MIKIKDTLDGTEHPIRISVYDTPDYLAQVLWLSADEAFELYNGIAPICADIMNNRAKDKRNVK